MGSEEQTSRLEQLCLDKGLRMTGQRRLIARILSEAEDHPDVEQLYHRASLIDPGLSLSTVYRTVRMFEEHGILERHDFGDGRSRYEEMPENHHDHLIDVQSGRVIEFRNERIEQLQREIAAEFGYKLVDHRLELYCVPMEKGRGGASSDTFSDPSSDPSSGPSSTPKSSDEPASPDEGE